MGLGFGFGFGFGRFFAFRVVRGVRVVVFGAFVSLFGGFRGLGFVEVRRFSFEVRVRISARGEAVASFFFRGVSGFGGRGDRFRLRFRVVFGGGVVLSGGRSFCFFGGFARWSRRVCFRVYVLFRVGRVVRSVSAFIYVDLYLLVVGRRLVLLWVIFRLRLFGRL